MTYELYVLNDEFKSPRDGRLLGTWEETYEYGGYHRKTLDQVYPIQKGQQYAVVVTQKTSSTYEILMDQSMNKNGWKFLNDQGQAGRNYAVGIVNKGESMYTSDGGDTRVDWADTIAELKEQAAQTEMGDVFDYDNFAIKAYADPPPVVVGTVPDISNMTESEALAALEEAGFVGQAGEPVYSKTVEVGKVVGQDIAAGSEREEGTVIAYSLSLGIKPAPTPPGSDVPPSSDVPPAGGTDALPGTKKSLVATGDNSLAVAGVLGGLAVLACGSFAVRGCVRKSRADK